MSFKLLAIRPLKGTNPKILKRLKLNCIYALYDGYDYLDKDENSLISCQNIELNNGGDLGKKDIYKVNKSSKVIDDFYTNSISICSIVGQNGSGKSTILELFYAFCYNASKKLFFDDLRYKNYEYKELDVEIYIEEKLSDGFFTVTKFKMCSKNNFKFTFSKTSLNYDFESKDGILIDNDMTAEQLSFYSIISNYSLYGLNSSFSDESWLNSVFYKNDSYSAPIVINPFREFGNIDVNKEYLLAQQRLISSKYLRNQERLIDDIILENIDYQINLIKNQFFRYNSNHEEHLVLMYDNALSYDQEDDTYLNEVESLSFESNNIEKTNYELKRIEKSEFLISKQLKFFIKRITEHNDVRILTACIIKCFKLDENLFTVFENYWNSKVMDKEMFLLDTLTDEDSKSQINFLAFLYLFKKLERISSTYDRYKKYIPLFNLETPYLAELHRIQNEFVSVIIDYNNKEDLKKSEYEFLKEFNNYLSKIIQINDLDKRMQDKCVILKIDEILLEIEDFKSYNDLWSLLEEYIIKKLYKARQEMFEEYLSKLMSDKSHITYKLKQVLSYFEADVFDDIKEIKKDTDKVSSYYIKWKDEFFKNKDAELVPLALFNVNIMVRSVLTNKVYSYLSLSSGEQQFTNSLITISYHLDNITSNFNDKDKKSYKNINIIFDEIELYFHPEYQRKYVNELLKRLKYYTDRFLDLKINVIFSTHSPFILSDIPSQNVLKLKEGVPVSHDSINSFGSNIHDLLADEFFLKNGFMGEFAKEKINDLVNYLREEVSVSNYDWNEKNIQDFIDLIGEPIIKSSLSNLYNKYRDKRYKDSELTYDYLLNFYNKNNATN